MKKVGNILFYIIVAIIIITSITLSFKNFMSGQSILLLGYGVHTIESDSMNPTIRTGALTIYREVKGSELVIDDIISFRERNNGIVTHRIVDIVNQEGKAYFVTKGDANDVIDAVMVTEDNLVGKIVVNIPYLGAIFHFTQTEMGLITLVTMMFITVLVVDVISKKFNKEELINI